MGRYTSNGQGTKLTKAEVLAYERLRDIGGMSPRAAAKAIGRSKSWAYDFEAKRRIESIPPAGVSYRIEDRPPDVATAAGLCMTFLADKDGIDEDGRPYEVAYREAFLSMLNRHGIEIVFPLAKLVTYLAIQRAEDLNAVYGDRLTEGPVTAEDVLETVSFVLVSEEDDFSPNVELPPELDDYYRDWVEGWLSKGSSAFE